MEEKNQDYLRGNGKIPIISVEAENLAEATHKALIACHDYGARAETPKHKLGATLGYDADMLIKVNNPDSDPKVYFPGIHDDGRGLMQYILEVTHGIHNHWKKTEENPERWGYTYNERFVNQLPFVFKRIKEDFNKKQYFGRSSQYTIWRAEEDIIPEQEDPPCWQRGQIRILKDEKGEYALNYQTDWRSRDLLKAWNENNIAQIELMKLFAAKISNMMGFPIKLGAYIDHSSSLHLYGLYIDRDSLEEKIKRMKEEGYENKSMGLEDYLGETSELKKLIAAQLDAEKKGYGLNQPKPRLEELGYDFEKFNYPLEWNTWPKEWDVVPDKKLLQR